MSRLDICSIQTMIYEINLWWVPRQSVVRELAKCQVCLELQKRGSLQQSQGRLKLSFVGLCEGLEIPMSHSKPISCDGCYLILMVYQSFFSSPSWSYFLYGATCVYSQYLKQRNDLFIIFRLTFRAIFTILASL